VNLNSETAQFIAENSEIPPDIIFKFTSAGGEDGEEVAAHKMILSIVSKIFRNMFYVHNTLDKSATEMVMEDTTKPVFQMMIDAVYNKKPLKENLQGKSVQEMFAVLYLVTKYKISALELAVKECLVSFPITEENALEVADDAMEYLATFEEAAQILLVSCAKFLEPKFTKRKCFIRFVAENGDRMATVHKLAVLIKDLSPSTPPTCSNCKMISTECLDGEKVTKENVKIGVTLKLIPAEMAVYRPGDGEGTGVIVEKDSDMYWFIRWDNNQQIDSWPISGGHFFRFKCH